jgi:hypothetical protein
MSAYEVKQTILYRRTDDPLQRLVLVVVGAPDGDFWFFFRSGRPDDPPDRSRAIFCSVSSPTGRQPRRRIGFTLAARAAEERIAQDDAKGDPSGSGGAGPVA